MLREYWWVILTIASMAISFLAYEKLYSWQGYGVHAATLAYILLLSITLHEVGHWLVLHIHGTRPFMFIMVIIGGAGPRNPDVMKTMHRRDLAIMLLAGPAANFLLVLIGLMMANYTQYVNFGWSLASINAVLIVFNLLPWGPLDGGRYIKLLFDSTDEKTDTIISMTGVAIALVTGVLLFAVGNFSIYTFVMVAGIVRAGLKDDPKAWRDSRAMDINTSWLTFIAFIAMWGIGFACYLLLPMWSEQFPR